jgi:hypothetical protein
VGTLYDKSGKPVEVPDAQMAQAILSGQYGTATPQVLVQARDGKTYSVPTANLQTFADKSPGVRVLNDAEVSAHNEEKRQFALQAQYGGAGGMLAAGVTGLASGATVGLSDTVLGALLSKEQKQYLEAAHEANPITTTATNVVGAIAPALLTGGETAPESLAALAGREGLTTAVEGGKVAKALGLAKDVITAPTRALGAVSGAAERGAEELLGTGAGGFTGLAQQAVAKVAGNAAQGAIATAAQDLGEDAISPDHQLTGEQILAHAGLGALLGGGIGLAAQGGSAAISRLLKSGSGQAGGFAESVAKEAASLQFAATGAKTKEIRTLVNKGLTPEEVGRWQLDELPKFKAADGPSLHTREGIGAAAENAMDDAVPKIQQHIDALDQAGIAPKVQPVLDRLRSDVVAPLEQHVDPAVQSIGKRIGALVDNSEAKLGPAPTFGQLYDLRKEIDSGIKFGAKDPGQIAANTELRKVRAIVEDEIGKQGSEATALGPTWKTGYDAAKKQYRMGASVSEAVESADKRMSGNNKVGLGDMITGASTHAGLLAAGHPHALLLAAAAAVGHHLFKTYGDAVGSRLLDAFAKSGTLQRIIQPQLATRTAVAAQKSYQSTAVAAMTGLMHGEASARAPGRPESTENGFARRAEAIGGVTKNPQAFTSAVQAHAEALGPGFATVASSYQNGALTSATYLAQQLPKPKPLDPLMPKAGSIEPSAAQKDSFNRIFDAVHEPLGLLKRASEGTLTRPEIDAVAATNPASLSDIQKRLQMALSEQTEALGPAQAAAIKMIMGVPVFELAPQPQVPTPGSPGGKGHKGNAGSKTGTARPLKLDLSTTELTGHRVGSSA